MQQGRRAHHEAILPTPSGPYFDKNVGFSFGSLRALRMRPPGHGSGFRAEGQGAGCKLFVSKIYSGLIVSRCSH